MGRLLLGFALPSRGARAPDGAGAPPDHPSYEEAFVGGAVLTMLADSMMPEAFEHGGKSVGLLVVLGFLVAGMLTVVQ